MVINDLKEILDYYELEPTDKTAIEPLEKAIKKGLIEIDDETERLNFTVHRDCRSTHNTNGKAIPQLRFRRMNAGDRKILVSAGENGAGDAMYKIIARMTGVVSADFDELYSHESAVCESIFTLFL